MLDKAKEIRKGEELDWTSLEGYLRAQLPELAGELSVAQFHGGHANLTYLLKFGQQEFVLRRPPFGKIAPGAHDMKREFKVLSKLYKFFPQAPRAYLLCEDESIIGARFVLVERRNGLVIRLKIPEVFKGFDKVEHRISDALVKAQANLHTVDVVATDLTELGRPEGFLNRQLKGWDKRWELSKTEENRAMKEVFEILSSDIPTPQAVAIVHNDLKFDNCQFQPDNPDLVSSIFDWDMTTLGDPLADFGTTLCYWTDDTIPHLDQLPLILKGNFPDKKYLIDKYADYSGYSMDKIAWYESLAYWKLAVVLQQLYKRYVDGATKDERMKRLGGAVHILANAARQVAGRL